MLRAHLFCALALVCAAQSFGVEIFRDDFNGASLDLGKWSVADWTFDGNRAYFGNTPALSGGNAQLRLDTYNPQHPGSYFLGTEIYSNQFFSRGTGLEFEERARTDAMPAGFVTSFFAYFPNADSTSDEIDFEFLSKQIANSSPAGMPVYLTTWNDAAHIPSQYNDGIHHSFTNPTIAGLNLNDFNTFTIRWLPDHTEWLINGVVVRSTTLALADAPMPIRMNFWAPDNSFSDAYNSSLQPASSAGSNQSYFYDIDYVSVRTIAVPEPAAWSLLVAGLLCAGAWRRGVGIKLRRRQATAIHP